MDMKSLPSAAYLRKLLDYDPVSGELRWKPRPPEMFSDRGGRYTATRNSSVFNARHAGRLAFTNRSKSGLQGEINDSPYLAHRVIWKMMTGEEPTDEIGHVNDDVYDNRFANLRSSTRAEATTNVALGTRNTSGVMGVTFDRARGKWSAQIRHNHRNNNLGRFDAKEDAIDARRKAERDLGFHPNHGRRRANR